MAPRKSKSTDKPTDLSARPTPNWKPPIKVGGTSKTSGTAANQEPSESDIARMSLEQNDEDKGKKRNKR